MTPQDYMDLPYAGMAERELRKRRLWQLTPQEKISKAIDDLAGFIGDAQSALDDAEYEFSQIEKEMGSLE